MDGASLEDRLSEELDRARVLAKEGSYEHALNSYMTVFEDSSPSPGFAGVRLSYVLHEVAEIGNTYEPATRKLCELRDGREESMLKGDYGFHLVMEWDALCRNVSPPRQIEFYNLLKQDSEKHQALLQMIRNTIWLQIIESKLYDELSAPDLAKKLAEITMTTSMHLSSDSPLAKMFDDKEKFDSLIEFGKRLLLRDGGAVFECSLAIKDDSLAEKAYELIMHYQKNGVGYASLVAAANRAGAQIRAKELVEEAQKILSEEEILAMKSAEQDDEYW